MLFSWLVHRSPDPHKFICLLARAGINFYRSRRKPLTFGELDGRDRHTAMNLKNKIGAAAMVVAVFGLGLWLRHRISAEDPVYAQVAAIYHEDEQPDERLTRWRSEANFLMLKSCTNDVIGFSRLIDFQVEDSDDKVDKWKGTATVDFVNHFGGIDRTNLHYYFRPYQTDLYAYVDDSWDFQQKLDALERASRSTQ